LAVLAAACVAPSVAPQEQPPAVVASVTAEERPSEPPAEPVIDLDRCRLYAASYRGLKCLDDEGRELATLLDASLEDGLFIDATTIVAWSRSPAQLFFFDVRAGELLDTLSLIPPQSQQCERERVWATTGIEARLPRTGPPERLCLEIINGAYEEIADVRVVADIDVLARTIAFGTVWGYEQCAADLPKASRCPSPAPITADADAQHPYFIAKGALHRWRASGRAERVWGPFAEPPPRRATMSELDPIDVGLASFEPVALTASGRYLILLGNKSKGDVGHVQPLLLDRSTGDLFALPETMREAWPAPLEVDAIEQSGNGQLESMWVLLDERPRILPERDRYALGDMLFEPGVGARPLPGRLIVAQ
jgi:hypothetical protein